MIKALQKGLYLFSSAILAYSAMSTQNFCYNNFSRVLTFSAPH